MTTVSDPTDLVAGCAAGDELAWQRLVRQFTPLVWTVARSHRLSDADCQDVYQLTFLKLIRRIGQLRSPDRLGSWITTTARRESLKHIERNRRYWPVGDSVMLDRPAPAEDRTDDLALRRVGNARVLDAFRRLPERDRRLLGLLMADSAPTYDEVGRALRIPRGSIGPLRQRALARLRDLLGPAVVE
ncbi:RNA polymerase sigma factor [Paractinoplanes deccanensis]|uniref:RNA polymerase sigma factor n=1 Tax=Paractinoplanes deccanensis TaxID=113561 RepID=A0ABQ3XYF0_9ACTN|nr:sigma-70 family RNA polymerase sigma factor [Actinoplanes deccanensis]GID72697.1 RNA polymerase sigma factor [Actinoplanes deccanensis]